MKSWNLLLALLISLSTFQNISSIAHCVWEDGDDCKVCMPGYYLSKDKHNCRKCSGDCNFCKNSTNCLSCPRKMYLQDNKCFDCIENCQICSESGLCDECIEGFYRNSNRTCSKGEKSQFWTLAAIILCLGILVLIPYIIDRTKVGKKKKGSIEQDYLNGREEPMINDE